VKKTIEQLQLKELIFLRNDVVSCPVNKGCIYGLMLIKAQAYSLAQKIISTIKALFLIFCPKASMTKGYQDSKKYLAVGIEPTLALIE